MSLMPQSVEQLARLGANIEITAEAGFMPQSIETIIQIAVANGSRVTIDAKPYMPQSLERFVQLGGKNITIRV